MKRMQPDDRSNHILSAAALVAARGSYTTMTREDVATQADVAPSLITHYFGTMAALRDAVVWFAVDSAHVPLVAQGIMHRHPACKRLPAELRRKAARLIGG
jgi:AcrR family transcriptional regulator